IVTSDCEEVVNYNEAMEFLSGAFNKPCSLNTVIASSGDYISTNETNNSNKVIFSLRERKVTYYSEECEPLSQILQRMVELDTSPIEKISKYKVTYILIAINVFIYLVSVIMAKNIIDIDIYTLVSMGAKVNILINDGQVWRLISAAFLHGGIVHIAFNMMALNSIGPQVEQIYGWKKYLGIYILSALGGTMLSYLLSPESVSVGASGAIFGLLGAMLVFAIKNKNIIGKSFMMNIIQVIVLNVMIGLSVANIDNYGHLGGLILGVITAIVFDYMNKNNKSEINN
ncbi:MAG: rhomboid family intramembrane serine protease, partial [Clostridium sp.]